MLNTKGLYFAVIGDGFSITINVVAFFTFVNKQTVQPIGSVTKSFTATAVGQLVAEGKVDWDTTPISKYMPDFQLKDPILTSQLTFADLLSHHTVSLLRVNSIPLTLMPLYFTLHCCRPNHS